MEEPQEIDLLVSGGFVLTMDEAVTSYTPGSVAVKDDRIIVEDRVIRTIDETELQREVQRTFRGLLHPHRRPPNLKAQP
jgi:hypothetical protein